MDQVHVVRHKVLVEGQSVRRVAREMAGSTLAGALRAAAAQLAEVALPNEGRRSRGRHAHMRPPS